MDWFEEAKKLYKPGVFGYKQIAKKLGISVKTVESRFRDAKRRGEILSNPQETNLHDSILKDLQKETTIKTLVDKYIQSERVIRAVVEDIKEAGYDIIEDNNVLIINKTTGAKENLHKEIWKGEKIIRFAIVSDTHLGSTAQQLTHLNTFYDICQHEGIETVYHCGDVVDGDDVYPGHKFEVHIFGADNQKRYAAENYPKRNGIKTKAISGNHDLKYYVKFGYDIIQAIANERDDIEYLGQYFARVELTPNCILQLEHPLGKPAYAISYKTQRKIDNMRGGQKPNILVEGHYHYSDYFFRRNVHAICCPSFQGPTKYSMRQGLESDNGGWIVEINVDDDGTITKFNPVFYPFYKVIERDW